MPWVNADLFSGINFPEVLMILFAKLVFPEPASPTKINLAS